MSKNANVFEVGYLAMSFDMINVGDLDLIAQARTQCTHLVLGVYSDDQVLRYSGRSPVIPLAERLLLVSHLRDVDRVVVHDEERYGGGEVVFDVVTSTEPSRPNSLVVRRVSQSELLIAALAPMPDEAVA